MATILASLSIGSLLAAASSAASAVGLTTVGGALGTAATAATGFGTAGGALGALGGGLAATGVPGLATVGTGLADVASTVGGALGTAVPGLGGTTVAQVGEAGASLAKTGVDTGAGIHDAGVAADAAQQAAVMQVAGQPASVLPNEAGMFARQVVNTGAAPAPSLTVPGAPQPGPYAAAPAPGVPSTSSPLTKLAMGALRAGAPRLERAVVLNEIDKARQKQLDYQRQLAMQPPGGGGGVFTSPQLGFGARLAREVSQSSRGSAYVPGLG